MRNRDASTLTAGLDARRAALEAQAALEPRVLSAFAKLGPKLAKTKPELFAPLRAAGWKVAGSG